MEEAITLSELSERALLLLKALVETYIQQGEPVGSKTLAHECSLSLSSATIRKIMAELEERGYVVSPHTSAGRVPTSMAYRLFVDGLVTMAPVDERRLEQMRASLNVEQGPRQLAESTSELLASVTQMASLVMVPKQDRLILRQVEFLTLSDQRILVILVLNEKEVQNRTVRVERVYSDTELKEAANYVNRELAGQTLEAICQQLHSALNEDKAHFDRLLATAQAIVPKALEAGEGVDGQACVVAGHSNLLGAETGVDVDKLKEVLSAFTQKQGILSLMEGCVDVQGVQIFIGEEAGSKMFDGFSLIGAPYAAQGSIVGVLAVIGPTRMPYQRVIPTVDITAKILSSALNQSN